MNKVLLATDFSESCETALEYLKNLVEGLQVTIDLIHSYHLPFTSSMTELENTIQQELETKQHNYKKNLEQLLAEINPKNRGMAHLVYGLAPSSDIVTKASEIEADLIVVSMREKYTKLNRIIGTVTARTIKKSNIPVLCIPYGAEFRGWKNLVHPTESENPHQLDDKLIAFTQWLEILLATPENTNLDLVHVIKSNKSKLEINYPNRPMTNLNFKLTYNDSLGEGIQTAIENANYDLLVIKKSPSNPLQRFFNSSKTTNLIHSGSLPVLIF